MMEEFQVSYWVTFSLFCLITFTCLTISLYFLLTRCCGCLRGRVDPNEVLEDPYSGKPRGVDQTVIESFPAFSYFAEQGKKLCSGMGVCVICLGVFKEGETLRSMPDCRHVFHSHCVDSWLVSHHTCPYCRASVVDGGGSGFRKFLPAGLARLV